MKRAMLFGAVVTLVGVWSAAPAGTIVSWGSNVYGLQDDVPEGDDFAAVAAGTKHSLALRSDGTVVGWGSNDWGQISIPEVSDVKAIAAGDEFSMALRETGQILVWGRNGTYKVVDNAPTGNDFAAIAAGGTHALAIRENGSAVAWGQGSSGQTAVPGGTDYLAVSGGGFHSVAVRGAGPAGSLAVWGFTGYGLGTVPTGEDFETVSSGVYHCVALRSNGTLAAWGQQDGSATDYGQVRDTPGDAGYVEIAAGDRFNVARKADGTLAAWGQSNNGQTSVPAGDSYVAIAAGLVHALAISEPGVLTLLAPNGGEQWRSGTTQTIAWTTEGMVNNVVIAYSTDNGATWAGVSPANEGNMGSYEWLVPTADSQTCLVRIASGSGFVTDVSDAAFTIFPCPLRADLTGDCVVDLADLAVMASEWLMGKPAEPVEERPGDFDLNGKVDWQDVEAFAAHWLAEDAGIYNLDGAGRVDLNDFAMFLQDWRWHR